MPAMGLYKNPLINKTQQLFQQEQTIYDYSCAFEKQEWTKISRMGAAHLVVSDDHGFLCQPLFGGRHPGSCYVCQEICATHRTLSRPAVLHVLPRLIERFLFSQ